MWKDDIERIQSVLYDYGVRETVMGLISALKMSADRYSDMGLKEKAMEAADMAERLADAIAEG